VGFDQSFFFMLVELNYKKEGKQRGGGEGKGERKRKEERKRRGGKGERINKESINKRVSMLPSPPSSLQAVGAVEPLSHPASEPLNRAVERQRHQSCRSH
jgi:hypothetical protein